MLVEPAAIVTAEQRGLHRLYVALPRAVTSLTVCMPSHCRIIWPSGRHRRRFRPAPQSAGALQQYDYFQVHVIARGIPIYSSYNMHANMYPSGNTYFHF